MSQNLSYKGRDVAIDYDDDSHATVTIGDKEFHLTRHAGALASWACDQAYFMSDDIVEVVRHLVDYMYVFDSPNTAPMEGPDHGSMPVPAGGILSAHALITTDEPGSHSGHSHSKEA